MVVQFATYHADKALQHYRSGRVRDAQECARIAGRLAARRGARIMPVWMLEWGTHANLAPFWHAGFSDPSGYVRERRRLEAKAKKRQRNAVADLFQALD